MGYTQALIGYALSQWSARMQSQSSAMLSAAKAREFGTHQTTMIKVHQTKAS